MSAYALSQRHEGWVLVPERNDDGGFSGGNMQQSGLQRLLANIGAGKVDIILVYKIDRLTRSLADFAKIVEVLDSAKASFVSITQSFNTTTSMGRLTLNMLLSFAQFEREVTGERIRDKIAASKRKGLWMGGPVPLGYDVENRKLVPNPAEAELVRQIMQRYLDLGSVVELADELNAKGYRTKVQRRTSGPQRGGCIFRHGTLYHLLSNRIYIGQLSHKAEWFAGEHQPIVHTPLWEAVQQKLEARASGDSRRLKAAQPALLVGLLRDGEGRAMTSSHATKPGKRYRYYVTRPDLLDGSPAWRVNEHDLESLVVGRLADPLTDRAALLDLAAESDAETMDRAIKAADSNAAILRQGRESQKCELLQNIVKVSLQIDRIELTVDQNKVAQLLDIEFTADVPAAILTLPVIWVCRGHQLRLIMPGPASAKPAPLERDEKLVAMLAEAHAASTCTNTTRSIPGGHRCTSKPVPHASRQDGGAVLPGTRHRQNVIEGRQPATMTARSLINIDLPLDWSERRSALGIA